MELVSRSSVFSNSNSSLLSHEIWNLIEPFNSTVTDVCLEVWFSSQLAAERNSYGTICCLNLHIAAVLTCCNIEICGFPHCLLELYSLLRGHLLRRLILIKQLFCTREEYLILFTLIWIRNFNLRFKEHKNTFINNEGRSKFGQDE